MATKIAIALLAGWILGLLATLTVALVRADTPVSSTLEVKQPNGISSSHYNLQKTISGYELQRTAPAEAFRNKVIILKVR